MVYWRTVERKAYGISAAGRQGLFVRNRQAVSAPYLLAAEGDLFKINYLRGAPCTWTQSYPQKMWGTRQCCLSTAVKAGSQCFVVYNQPLINTVLILRTLFSTICVHRRTG